ncbi:hypothetical protein COEREDRAFT_83518 [Coemansia reversa NRRL 1564]|uniref:Ndc10 domain-containing protein n=1 Tax=Coemansia reversa (strain ATCC 12441 / NRRL 1564) TaxID=763665 RepID=A0A2G5B335_COERN|nr:hypothetical protein COEREDRAFT_83518 [Coemansia reversa NRRL 1564]|eukprot:PIA13405.1 hypothetical protein COEREDRAFT_83518 [Coemansia reversa NRRL 1564]
MNSKDIHARTCEILQGAGLLATTKRCEYRSVYAWLEYCCDNGNATDIKCTAARFWEYAEHCIETGIKQKRVSKHAYITAMSIKLKYLWIVWGLSEGNNIEALKGEFESMYESALKLIKERIDVAHTDLVYTTGTKIRINVSAVSPAAMSMQKDDGPDIQGPLAPAREYAHGPRTSHSMQASKSAIASAGAPPNTPRHKTNPNGTLFSFDRVLSDKEWRLFSNETEIFLNCVLMRRSSYCSLEMRLWYLISVSTWFDANIIRTGITLGSLKLHSRGPTLSSAGHSIFICAQPQDCAGQVDDHFEASQPHGRKTANAHGIHRAELLRHRGILQCPWNALAMLLFYKWHVLNEPPPDFTDSSWFNQPLFHTSPVLEDDHLAQFCGDIYDEFREAVGEGQQRRKYISAQARIALNSALNSSAFLKNTIAATGNVYMTRRSLQNGVCFDVQLANAGFCVKDSKPSYHIPRQGFNVPKALEERIFPFVDELPDFDDIPNIEGGIDLRSSVVGFCNMLKLLRTTLLQDQMILFDNTFYRRMLQNNSVLSSDIFQSMEFISSSDYIRDVSWSSDFLPLVANMPRDVALSQVVPCTTPLTHVPEVHPEQVMMPPVLARPLLPAEKPSKVCSNSLKRNSEYDAFANTTADSQLPHAKRPCAVPNLCMIETIEVTSCDENSRSPSVVIMDYPPPAMDAALASTQPMVKTGEHAFFITSNNMAPLPNDAREETMGQNVQNNAHIAVYDEQGLLPEAFEGEYGGQDAKGQEYSVNLEEPMTMDTMNNRKSTEYSSEKCAGIVPTEEPSGTLGFVQNEGGCQAIDGQTSHAISEETALLPDTSLGENITQADPLCQSATAGELDDVDEEIAGWVSEFSRPETTVVNTTHTSRCSSKTLSTAYNNSDDFFAESRHAADTAKVAEMSKQIDELLTYIRSMDQQLSCITETNQTIMRKVNRVILRHNSISAVPDWKDVVLATSSAGTGQCTAELVNTKLLHSLKKIQMVTQRNSNNMGCLANIVNNVLENLSTGSEPQNESTPAKQP